MSRNSTSLSVIERVESFYRSCEQDCEKSDRSFTDGYVLKTESVSMQEIFQVARDGGKDDIVIGNLRKLCDRNSEILFWNYVSEEVERLN